MTKDKKPPDILPTEQIQQLTKALDELKLYKIKELIAEEMVRLNSGQCSATELLLRPCQ